VARCSCTGSQCNCLIVAGPGIRVTGSGHPADPYVISLVTAAAELEADGVIEYEQVTPDTP
jgi:hypothetical protein